MADYYSAGSGGFFNDAVYGPITEQHGDETIVIRPNRLPPDVVEITADEKRALMEGQGRGMVIVPDAAGRPVLAVAPQPKEGEDQ